MLTWRTTNPGSCFQKTKDFWALTHVFRGSKVLNPGSCFQRPRILDLGSCFQRTKDFFFFLASTHANVCGLFTLVPEK